MSKELCDTNRCHYQVGNIDRRSLIPLLGAGTAFLMLAGKALAQQVPIPTTAAQVPGPDLPHELQAPDEPGAREMPQCEKAPASGRDLSTGRIGSWSTPKP